MAKAGGKVYLKEWRKRLNITQAALARLSGISRQSIIGIESGKQDPRSSTVLRLELAMKVASGKLYSPPPDY